jgi:hypothetical protein
MISSRRIVHENIQDGSQRIGCGKRRCLAACREIDRGHVFGLAAGEKKYQIDQMIIEVVRVVEKTYPVTSDLGRPD